MKVLLAVGLVVLILGIVSFIVAFPHSEHHDIRAGDLHMGVKTEHSERLSPGVSVLLVVVGAGMMIAGRSTS